MCQAPYQHTTRAPAVKEESAVTTQSQAKKDGKHTSLKVASSSKSTIVDRKELVRLQCDDKRLEKY